MNAITSTPRKIFGYILLGSSILGLVISLIGLLYVVRTSASFAEGVITALDQSATALETTADALVVVEATLDQTAEAIGAVQGTTTDVQTTISSTGDLLDSLGVLTGEDLPGIIEDTQGSLESAEQSAAVIDNFLLVLSSVPLIGPRDYDPDMPLSESLADVNTSLDDLPDSLIAITDDFATTGDDLNEAQVNLAELNESLGGIMASLEAAQNVTVAYGEAVDVNLANIRNLQEKMPRWIRTGRNILILVLIWLGVSQIGLLFQSFEMIGFQPSALEDRIAALEAKVNNESDGKE